MKQMKVIEYKYNYTYNLQIQDFLSDFHDCNVLIVDHAVSTGYRLRSVSELIKSKGGDNIYSYTPNGLFSTADCLEVLRESPIKKVLTTDTVYIDDWKKRACPKIDVVSVASGIAEIIKCQHYVHKIPYHEPEKDE